MPHPRELPIPRPVTNDQKAFEIARIWIVAGAGQYVSLATGVVGDPKAWGVLLVNMAKHVANAYQQVRGLDANQTLAGIKAAFEAEWNNPTDKPTGEVIDKSQGENPK
jgi:hypothetical protein